MRYVTRLPLLGGLALLAACGGGGASPTSTTAGLSTVANVPITSTVSGVVLDRGGAAVQGIAVTVYSLNNNTGTTTLTDAAGHYSVSGLHTGANSDYAIFAESANYGLYPSVADAAGTIERSDFNGNYRTVIRFASMPTHDVTSASFAAYGRNDAVARLPSSGQSTSVSRFTDNVDGTVTDHLTGLVWLRNAGCFTSSGWSSALASVQQLASGSCGLSDGSAAGQWRMPNANELESLVDISQANPAVAAGSPFTNVDQAHAYWSSTTYMAGPLNAMAIRFTDGRWINGIDPDDGHFNNDKATSVNALWPVRTAAAAGVVRVLATGVYHGQGGDPATDVGTDASLQLGAPLTSPRFIDNADGTLHDTVTGLTWLKQADCLAATWANALAAANGLASGQCGLTDGSAAGQWRLPNRSEMLSLSDRAPTFPQASYFNGQAQTTGAVTGPVIFRNFVVSDYYWTSSANAADPTRAWGVYSCDFGAYDRPKTDLHHALAVR